MFQKGKSGNPRGRPPKAINKVARPLKLQISEFLDQRFAELPAIWQKLSPRDKTRMIVDLLPYVVPRMTNLDLDLTFANLSDDDLTRIIDTLLINDNEKK